MNLIFLSILIASLGRNVNSVPKDRIKGWIVEGEDSELIPFQVSVQYNQKHVCAGIILDEDTVLSSAR